MSMQQVGIYSYDPAKQIGRGSFADVFKGTGPSGVEVAIKRIHRSRLAKESSKKLLTSEIRTMQEAQHRNVVCASSSSPSLLPVVTITLASRDQLLRSNN